MHFGRGELLRDRHQILHGEQADGILVIRLEAAIDGKTVAEDVRLRQVFDQSLRVREQYSIDGHCHAYTEPFCRGPANHRRIIRGEGAVTLSQAVLDSSRDLRVDGGVEGGGRCPRGEPFPARQPLQEGNIVLVDLLLSKDGRNLGYRLGSLDIILVPNKS